jgi:hypothetical protein
LRVSGQSLRNLINDLGKGKKKISKARKKKEGKRKINKILEKT